MMDGNYGLSRGGVVGGGLSESDFYKVSNPREPPKWLTLLVVDELIAESATNRQKEFESWRWHDVAVE